MMKIAVITLTLILFTLLYFDYTNAHDECASRGHTGDDLSECIWLLENN